MIDIKINGRMRRLLIIGGVESNPGPKSGEAIPMKCETCKRNLRAGVLCNCCEIWFHLSYQRIERKEIVEEFWMCKDCGNQGGIEQALYKLRDEMMKLREDLHQAETRIDYVKEREAVTRIIERRASLSAIRLFETSETYNPSWR